MGLYGGMGAPDEVLDRELVVQLFTATDPADQEKVRRMVEHFRAEMPVRLRNLLRTAASVAPAVAIRELHQLRGAVGGFGLCAAAAHLESLEIEWPELAGERRQERLEAAQGALAAGIKALEQQLPSLGVALRPAS